MSGKLPETRRIIYLLKYGGWEIKDVANIYNVGEESVKQRLRAAGKKMIDGNLVDYAPHHESIGLVKELNDGYRYDDCPKKMVYLKSGTPMTTAEVTMMVTRLNRDHAIFTEQTRAERALKGL